jgi:co-chaperonin GroES (HSP10)
MRRIKVMDCEFKKVNMEEKNPFLVDGEIVCGLKMIGSKVIIWTDAKPLKLGSFWLPLNLRDREKLSVGTVISIGPGYFDKNKNRYVYSEVKPGQRVVFDNTTPWPLDVKDPSGKIQSVRLMTELDIKGIINCEECTECNF